MNDEANANARGDLPPAGATELDAKLKLINASYAEVLDATKHQDDKIGQLLIGIAFLTAATLALAALGIPSFITRAFVVQPFALPLGLIALAAFLVGVLFSVMLLLASLGTPLRLPGLDKKKSLSKNDYMQRVQEVSQIYFYEISRISVDQWTHKWDVSAEELKRQRLKSLIKETHNLGLRTSAKYDRTTEALALLSLSLLEFALSVIFVSIIAGSPGGNKPIMLELWQRIIIGGIFGCYFWAQLLGRIRYDRQAVNEAPSRRVRSLKRRQFRGELWYAILVAALIVDTLIYDRSWPGLTVWIGMTVVLTCACCIAFGCAQRVRWGSLRLAVPTIIYAGLAVFCGIKGWYVGQLGVASLAILCLIGYAMLQPTLSLRRSRQEYWDNQGNQQAGKRRMPLRSMKVLGRFRPNAGAN
jgi:uncharacterized integral membrane protein